jgi:hypothetical protein
VTRSNGPSPTLKSADHEKGLSKLKSASRREPLGRPTVLGYQYGLLYEKIRSDGGDMQALHTPCGVNGLYRIHFLQK